MEKDFLHKITEIKKVEAPDFLLERIISKIDTEQVEENKTFSYSLVFAVLLLVLNTSILTQYFNSEVNLTTSEEVVNPYDFSAYNLMDNE